MEEPYSGGSNEAWIAFIKNWARENGYPRRRFRISAYKRSR